MDTLRAAALAGDDTEMPTSVASLPILHVRLFLWSDSVVDDSIHVAHK